VKRIAASLATEVATASPSLARPHLGWHGELTGQNARIVQYAPYDRAARREKCRNILLAILTSLVLHAGIVFVLHGPRSGQVRMSEKSLKVQLMATAKQISAPTPLVALPIPVRHYHSEPIWIPAKRRAEKSAPAVGPGTPATNTTANAASDPGTEKITESNTGTEKTTAPNIAIQPESIQRVVRQIARETQASAEAQGKHLERLEEKESPLAREVKKEEPGDCRTAYANLGLLAVPFLLRDSVSESGCRWRH